MWPILASYSPFSCVSLQRAGITYICHYAKLSLKLVMLLYFFFTKYFKRCFFGGWGEMGLRVQLRTSHLQSRHFTT
jgi:hypothetical protein